MQNPTKTMVKLTRCSLVTTCSNLKERSATNQGQSEIFRKHTCIFFFDIIDALSKAIVNHPTNLPYIYIHIPTKNGWFVLVYDIALLALPPFMATSSNTKLSSPWMLLHGHGHGCVQLAQVPYHLTKGFLVISWDFMEVEPSNIYQTYGNIRQYYIKNDWLMIIRGCIQNIVGYHP